ILGSTPVYRLPEAYRRFPRPSSAPDAKASTMRSHTLTNPIRVSSMCARNVSNTLVFDDKKITLHKQHKNVVDARVHYTILKTLPNTTNRQPRTRHHRQPGRSVSRHHTHTWLVIPGPNNVPVLAPRLTRVDKAHPLTTQVA